MNIRPSWDAWGLSLAATVATRADCTRRQVGAVLMDAEHRIVAEGYNGAPAGDPGCLTDGACPRGRSNVDPGSSYDTGPGSCIALHAEQNALLRASWDDMVGSTLYVTDKPCDGCMRMIKGTPIIRVLAPGFMWEHDCVEYAIRMDDGETIVGPKWGSPAEVLFSYHGFNTNRAYGRLVKRHSPDHEWEYV